MLFRSADVRKPANPPVVGVPVPQDVRELVEGHYYSAMGGLIKVEVKDDELVTTVFMGGDKWVENPMLPRCKYDGSRFLAVETGLETAFEEAKGTVYMSAFLLGGVCPLGHKAVAKYPMADGWKNRMGKKYLLSNLSTDEFFGGVTGTIITTVLDDGVIAFAVPSAPEGPVSYAFAISCGDDDTDMFLNAPGMGSRDQYAPFIVKNEQGVEVLSEAGHKFIAADSLTEQIGRAHV